MLDRSKETMQIETVNVEIPAGNSITYPILIGFNLINRLGNLIKDYTRAQNVLIVTNKTIYPLFGDKVKESLENEKISYEFVILEDGEKYKNINTLELIWDKAIQFRLERKDAIVALGGGVVGDITGFAAATYLRGIDFIQVPTTLLAQVDSSVGGKVAINHKLGKNLIGNFYQPKLVVTDTDTLKSLPVEELKVGLSEILKYGFIEKTCGFKGQNLNLIRFLKEKKDEVFSLEPQTITQLIKYCCELKAAVVGQDEKEAGLRAILNFGHTIGHAVEKNMNYENFTHGQAVAVGMRGAFYITRQRGLISEAYLESALSLIDQYGLDYKVPDKLSTNDIMDAMLLDKKVQSNKVRFVLPTNIAEVEIFNDVSDEHILSSLKNLY